MFTNTQKWVSAVTNKYFLAAYDSPNRLIWIKQTKMIDLKLEIIIIKWMFKIEHGWYRVKEKVF